ncbi:hypothetical protein LSH36_52g03026 [Paralvinella palmiformis]|uniref:WD repeat-containing protein WRAP73 n=1 Tax=Paralvinella palmiformis TaxID=53620 RepID=A0AAD9NCI8_9ANNE|nr:hypothetical protein LSH36_52g03026 [Paralvinella palmiformis]
MNFSELFKQTAYLCKFSPDGRYLANAVQYRLIVRDFKTLQIQQLFTCLDAIQHIEWSSDSQFILCGMYKRGLVQVWSLEEPEWTCKIDEGSAGLVDVRWSADGRHILTTADFHLRITVWSLINKSVSYIKYPKACQKGLSFSPDGKFLALAERRDCKDYISVFVCSTWQLVKHFEPETEDLTGLEWSPNGRVICVWESCLQYKILLYTADGRCIDKFTAYNMALGIKSVAWSPTSQFLAIGSYDQKVRILNHLTWKTIVEHAHPTILNKPKVVIYKEVVSKPQLLQGETEAPSQFMYRSPSRYDILEDTVQLPAVKPDLNRANPKMGVGTLAFSPDSRYIYTRNDNMPCVLWIWEMTTLDLCVVLIQDLPIKCVGWDPCQARLALCTGSNKVYMWSPAGCLSVDVPIEGTFNVQSVKWSPNGEALLLLDPEHMAVCFLSENEANLSS